MFIVVAIVIFGIFVVLANTLFGSEGLTKDIKMLFEDSIEQAQQVGPHEIIDIGIFKVDKTSRSILGFSASGSEQIITELVIPSEIGGIKIKSIGDNAFRDVGLTKVTFEEGIEHIGKLSFYGNKLTTLKLPDSIYRVGSDSFRGNLINDLDLGNGIEIIGALSFYGNKLTKVDIPNSVTEIHLSAFRINKLTEVNIGNNVKFIGHYAFSINWDLKTLTIPESVEMIETSFVESTALETLNLPIGLKPLVESEPEILSKKTNYAGTDRETVITYYDETIVNYYD